MTLLFLEADFKNIEALKWIFIGFENLSDMKINYAKSELIPLSISPKLGSQLASNLGCKVGSLPINYLGVPLHWKNLTSDQWNFLIDKIENKF